MEQSSVDPRRLSSYRNIETFRNLRKKGRLRKMTATARKYSRIFTMGEVHIRGVGGELVSDSVNLQSNAVRSSRVEISAVHTIDLSEYAQNCDHLCCYEVTSEKRAQAVTDGGVVITPNINNCQNGVTSGIEHESSITGKFGAVKEVQRRLRPAGCRPRQNGDLQRQMCNRP
jgi:hypothetical protein